MARVSATQYAVLGVLSMMPASGYEIKKFCDESIAHFWNENYGNIYPVLKALEKEGMVTSSVETQTGRPAKTVYSITPAGTAALRSWFMLPVEEPPRRHHFLLKFVLSRDMPREALIGMLEGEAAKARKELESYGGIALHLQSLASSVDPVLIRLWLGSLEYGKRFAALHAAWCEDMIEAFGATA